MHHSSSEHIIFCSPVHSFLTIRPQSILSVTIKSYLHLLSFYFNARGEERKRGVKDTRMQGIVNAIGDFRDRLDELEDMFGKFTLFSNNANEYLTS